MKNATKLSIVLAISIAFFGTEIAVGFRTKSLALVADAFHYLNDIIAYSLAYFAARLKEKDQRTPHFSYAFHRGELVGAFFNGVFLLALALSIFLQSIERFVNLQPVEKPFFVLVIGCVGFALNVLSIFIVHDHGGHSHGVSDPGEAIEMDLEDTNMPTQPDSRPAQRGDHNLHNHVNLLSSAPPTNMGLLGVLVHLFGDAVNNVGVVISAIIMWKTTTPSRFYADPAVSLAISIIIFASALPLTMKSGRILLEAAPVNLDLDLIKDDLLAVPGVLSIHDMHIWQLTQSISLASFHVRVSANADLAAWEVIEEILQQCCAAYGIAHVTIAPEVEHGGVGNAENARARAACNDGYGCAVDDVALVGIRRRAARVS